MKFDNIALDIETSEVIGIPSHQISSNPLLNFILRKGISLLERQVLGIGPDIKVIEMRYQSPFKTRFPKK